jgi:hypothetical protein
MHQNTFITKITEWINYKIWIMQVTKWSCWILASFRLALGGLPTICVYSHRLCPLLVDATPCSLVTPDVSTLQRSHKFLIRPADVVLGSFDSLDCSIRLSPFSLLLAHLALVFRLRCLICDILSNFLLLITFELQTFVYLCSSHFTKLSKFYMYV